MFLEFLSVDFKWLQLELFKHNKLSPYAEWEAAFCRFNYISLVGWEALKLFKD